MQECQVEVPLIFKYLLPLISRVFDVMNQALNHWLNTMRQDLGGCPRIESLLLKSHFGHLFRKNSLNSATIRLIFSKNLTQDGFPSLRLLFSDSLLAVIGIKATVVDGQQENSYGINLDSKEFVGGVFYWPENTYEVQFNDCSSGEVILLETVPFDEPKLLEK